MTVESQPSKLSARDALDVIREIATDGSRIFVVAHATKRRRQREITRRQIELCCQKGSIVEGPFVNAHGHWQANLFRHAAGEEIICVVAIEWRVRLIVVTVFRGRG
jgi:hypothetical protein